MSLRSILLASFGVLAGAFVFAGPAEAGTVTVTPSVQGAGTVKSSASAAYLCNLLLPAGAQPKNTDASPCAPTGAAAQEIPIPTPTGIRFIIIPGAVTATAEASPGWRFIGWQNCTPAEGGANGAACTAIVRDTNYALAPKAVFKEIVPVTFAAAPGEFTNSTQPSFSFSSPGASSFTCAIDAVAVPCGPGAGGSASVTAPNPLTEGPHTFAVRATKNTNVSLDAAVANFTVDTTAPVVALDPSSGPGEGALQAVNVETFKFSSGEPATFECSLDGAAFVGCDSGVRFERLTAGVHRFDVRALDRAGNVGVPTTRSWTVSAADDDNDGFNARIDCNDANAAIRPGVIDVPNNGIDENCDGADATTPVVQGSRTGPPEQVIVTIAYFAKATAKSTKFSTLQVKNVPFGATVTVTCKGKGCPSGLKGKGFTKKNAFGTVTLANFIKKPLKAGDTITVLVSKPDAINAVKIVKIRPSKKPLISTRCQPPGAKSPVAC